MNKYQISKLLAIFFSLTTVIIYIYASSGALFVSVGSVQTGVLLYGLNTLCLVTSFLAFIWQRAHRDTPHKKELDLLTSYSEHTASTEPENSQISLKRYFIDNDELIALKSHPTSITKTEAMTGLKEQETILIASYESPVFATKAKVISISSETIMLEILR